MKVEMKISERTRAAIIAFHEAGLSVKPINQAFVFDLSVCSNT